MTDETATVGTGSPEHEDGGSQPAKATSGGARGDEPAGDAEAASPGHGRGLRLPAWLLPAGVVAAMVALPLWGMWIAPGPPMEEGFMLVFPERILEGDVPNRDFLHLYGPGSLWLLAGVYQVLGVDLWVERLVGLAQIAGLVGGVTYVGYRWGRWIAISAGASAAFVIMPAIGLTALAWVGGVALALWATILAARSETRRLFLAGLLGGLALLFRPDLVLALGLPFGALWLWSLEWAGRRRLLGGVVAGASPYLIHFAMAGPGNAFRGLVIEPVFDLRPGRSLGFPPSWTGYDSFLNKAFAWRDSPWPLPELPDPKQIFFWVPLLLAACVLLVAAGIRARRAGSPHGWLLLTLALFSVGALPQAVQRPDTAHLAWVSAVPFALVPVALAEWFRLNRAKDKPGRLRDAPTWLTAALIPALVPLVAMIVVIPNFTVQWYADYAGQTFGVRREGHSVEHRGRTFHYGRGEVAEAARALLADVEDVTEPGDVLIVGPGNFRFTPYSEVYLYFLLPQLEPGTHYIEMDPGVANAEDSGLADELREADVVILSTMYDPWEEPNASRDPGSPEPDQVLEEQYCLHDRYGANQTYEGRGFYELYLKC